ncbi:hypothetical protein LINPERPRIM_LOCUS15716 [Linum perenne]
MMNWVQGIATAWGFMLLMGLMCCCLSSKPRHHSDVDNSETASCACDGGYAAGV